jgi:hypothetical protein
MIRNYYPRSSCWDVGFDLLKDKGMIYAQKTDKYSPEVYEAIEAMLHEVSQILRPCESGVKNTK